MKSQDWLCNYQFTYGVQKSFQGLVYRAAYLNESEIAFEIFNQHYAELQDCYYAEFFPELSSFASEKISNLLAV